MIYYHVGALLSPTYKNLRFSKHLPECPFTDIESIVLLGHVVARLSPEAVKEAMTCAAQISSRKRKISDLLLVDDDDDEGADQAKSESSALRNAIKKESDSFRLIPAIPADAEGSCPLVFWKNEELSGRHCLLTLIARLVYCPPVSSTSSEREFRTAGLIQQKKLRSATTRKYGAYAQGGPLIQTRARWTNNRLSEPSLVM